jgi:hypothetical protein
MPASKQVDTCVANAHELERMEVEASRNLLSYEYDILSNSKIMKAIKEMSSVQENLVLDLQDIQRHKLDSFRKLNIEEKSHHRSFEHKLMNELMGLQKDKIERCRQLFLEEAGSELVSHLELSSDKDSVHAMDCNNSYSYPNPSLSSLYSSKGSEMKCTHLCPTSSQFADSDDEHVIPVTNSDSNLRRDLNSNNRDSGDSGDASMDLNSRFNALKIALDQRPSMASRSSNSRPSFKSPYAPISPGDLRVVVTPADRPQPPPHPSIGPRPPPPSAARARQDRQPGGAGKSAAGPRLQRPTWMHHAAPSGPSASPPRWDSASAARKGAAAARGPAHWQAPPQHRWGPGSGSASGGSGDGPAPSPPGSARGGGRLRNLADDATPPPTELQYGSESDVEEAEHRAIMRRLDDSAEWAGPDPGPARRAELLLV